MSRKRKCYGMDSVEYVPPLKKRRISTPPLSQRHQNSHNHNIKSSSQHSLSSTFSCAESSQFSLQSQWSQFSQHSVSHSQSSQLSSHSQNEPQRLFAEHIPDVLLQEILSYNTPFELSVCAVVNKFYNTQCKLIWQRLNKCCISPKLFPSLIEDDYDSQFEYNPSRHPHRTHFTLNWIIHKLQQCIRLQHVKIQRTMMNGQMFQILIQNCPNLQTLHLDENPWIFLLGKHRNSKHGMDIDMSYVPDTQQMYSANLFDIIVPTFNLTTLVIESMYMNMTDITFNKLLQSSCNSLQKLVLKKRDPFTCSYCNRVSLCKWHKCEDCELRSYCSRDCQSEDWWQHQYVCSYHSPKGMVQQLQNSNRLNGGFLDIICNFKNLVTLDLTWCYIVHYTALQRLSVSCSKLENILLNGCDIDDLGLVALANNLECIKVLHCRAARYVTDKSINVLSEKHGKSLTDLDISRCCLVTKKSVLSLMHNCVRLESLSIACGIKRGGWMWTLDDMMVNVIMGKLKGIKRLEYLCANNGELSKESERKLFGIEGIEIQKITTDMQTELRNVNGHLEVGFVKRSSKYNNPVLMECIVKGRVVYSHRFKR